MRKEITPKQWESLLKRLSMKKVPKQKIEGLARVWLCGKRCPKERERWFYRLGIVQCNLVIASPRNFQEMKITINGYFRDELESVRDSLVGKELAIEEAALLYARKELLHHLEEFFSSWIKAEKEINSLRLRPQVSCNFSNLMLI